MSERYYELGIVPTVLAALRGSKNLIQVITGPRQVGKSTAAKQIGSQWEGSVIFVSADSPLPPGPEWVRFHWETARKEMPRDPLLIIDEIQKVNGWSETVKALWDEDQREGKKIRVLLLGSSSLLLRKGLSESLAGRFFLNRLGHWQYGDMKAAFGTSLDTWLYFGGYPGTVPFFENEERWKTYVRDSLIETVISRDVLQMQNIAKPALLRHLFMLAASYPARILSYNKMLGQLTDAGNTTTLAHYVRILESAFLLSGLEQFKMGERPKRGSSPKLVLWNNALVNALSMYPYRSHREQPEYWGRLVENGVGAALLNEFRGLPYELYYWRNGEFEVDYVLHAPAKTWAIEVKSSRMKKPEGLSRFLSLYPAASPMIIGGSGMPLEEFFATSKRDIFI
jgi:hypothetical protein